MLQESGLGTTCVGVCLNQSEIGVDFSLVAVKLVSDHVVAASVLRSEHLDCDLVTIER